MSTPCRARYIDVFACAKYRLPAVHHHLDAVWSGVTEVVRAREPHDQPDFAGAKLRTASWGRWKLALRPRAPIRLSPT